MENKVISAETVVDGIFDRDLVLVPIKSCFEVSEKQTKILLYENNKEGPNPFLGEAIFYMS